MCREVFFFESGGASLYGSLYSASELSCPLGLVCCASWGVEADRCDPLVRSVALAAAELGGAALVFHYPGYGDSHGDLADAGLADLARAAGDAAAEGARRRPGVSWAYAGFMFGASVACLALDRRPADLLLLVQPALRPSAYFTRLSRHPPPLQPGSGTATRDMVEPGSAPGMAYGYPVPRRIVGAARRADSAVAAALDGFSGEGAVIRHQQPEEADSCPQRFDRVAARGTWRFGSQNNPRLANGVIGWLKQRMA